MLHVWDLSLNGKSQIKHAISQCGYDFSFSGCSAENICIIKSSVFHRIVFVSKCATESPFYGVRRSMCVVFVVSICHYTCLVHEELSVCALKCSGMACDEVHYERMLGSVLSR